jgi:plasmid stability protein
MEAPMPVNLSIKNVPDDIAQALRERAARNHRSLQGELLRLLEAAARESGPAWPPEQPSARAGSLDIEQAAERAHRLFPQGTESSVGYIRSLRDNG